MGARFLKDVREGRMVDWADRRILLDQANHVLAALGLLHMQVKVMVDHNNDEYGTEISEGVTGQVCVAVLIHLSCVAVVRSSGGGDKTVAELFAHHSLASGCDGNLLDEFCASIGVQSMGRMRRLPQPGCTAHVTLWLSMQVSVGREHGVVCQDGSSMLPFLCRDRICCPCCVEQDGGGGVVCG